MRLADHRPAHPHRGRPEARVQPPRHLPALRRVLLAVRRARPDARGGARGAGARPRERGRVEQGRHLALRRFSQLLVREPADGPDAPIVTERRALQRRVGVAARWAAAC